MNYLLNESLYQTSNRPTVKTVIFRALSRYFFHGAKSYSDELSQGQDRDVPATQLQGSPYQHIRANGKSVKGYLDGYRTGKIFRQPADIIIGGVASYIGIFRDTPANLLRIAGGAK